MSSPESKSINALAADYRKYYGIDIHLTGQTPTDELGATPAWLVSIISELVHNSPLVRTIDDQALLGAGESLEEMQNTLQRQIEGSKSRRHRIDVIIGGNFVVVDDGISQPNPEAALTTIQAILKSGKPGTTKTTYLGGAGLFSIQEILKTRDGHLRYRIVENKIVTVVSWDPGQKV